MSAPDQRPDDALARAKAITFEISNDFLGSANRDGFFTSLSPSWERNFPYSREELMAKPFLNFVHPADRERTSAELERLFGGDGSISFQNRYSVKDDAWRWLSWQATVQDGEAFFIAHDITEQIEEQWRYQLLKRMVEGIDDAIFTTTIDGLVTSWNPVCEEIFGYSAAEAIGRPMANLIFTADHKNDSPKMIERLVGGEGVRQDTAERRRKDGTLLNVSQTASLMRDEDLKIDGVVVVSRDISELGLGDAEYHGEIDTLVWVGRVRDAIDEDRIVFFAQPIFGLRGQPVSYELLCRMRNREEEIISPGKFLPAAENYGLVEELDLLAIREAARLIALGHEISINLSAATVGRLHIVDVIADELSQASAKPSRLMIEITETALMKNMALAQRFAAELNAIGVKLALDDFGTGFGGFTYLKKLSVHRLKIDVEFVQDLSSSLASQHLVKAVVALADGFGLDTVAEGVEDEASAKLVAEYGVDCVQGFYYARPGPIADTIGEPLASL